MLLLIRYRHRIFATGNVYKIRNLCYLNERRRERCTTALPTYLTRHEADGDLRVQVLLLDHLGGPNVDDAWRLQRLNVLPAERLQLELPRHLLSSPETALIYDPTGEPITLHVATSTLLQFVGTCTSQGLKADMTKCFLFVNWEMNLTDSRTWRMSHRVRFNSLDMPFLWRPRADDLRCS